MQICCFNNTLWYIQITSISQYVDVIYRIAGKFGVEFNLAVWRILLDPNLIPPITRVCMHEGLAHLQHPPN